MTVTAAASSLAARVGREVRRRHQFAACACHAALAIQPMSIELYAQTAMAIGHETCLPWLCAIVSKEVPKKMRKRLFSRYSLAGLRLANRVVMTPMKRNRASDRQLAPTAMSALYYAQRASAGLIAAEGTPVSPQARGWARTPGICPPAQLAGWRNVTARCIARPAASTCNYGMSGALAIAACGRIVRHPSDQARSG
ncbi:MAG TPA: hypothetical protein DIT03_01415 [Candidatus Accumulibacter sp.]|nr:hypothetical protein [Accumulibacter sp.]HCN66936.1 hypothetical protein [Accumulibacter sp.]HCV14046.1 hypothetical protein [Accumulibacter sp.]